MVLITYGMWRHQRKRLLLRRMLPWLAAGVLRYALVIVSTSDQAWIERDLVVIAIRCMVGVEQVFFVWAFKVFLDESIKVVDDYQG